MKEGLNKKEEEKIPLDKWLKLPRIMETISFGDKRQEDYSTSEKDKMSYGINNNAIAFVDKDGNYYVAPHSSERVNELEEAGYKNSGLGVPFSNREHPTDSVLLEKWRKLNEDDDLNSYKLEAEKKKIKKVAGEWLNMDGVETNFGSDKYPAIEKNTTGFRMASDRLESVGTYGSNNSVLGFVDEEGHLYVGPYTNERIQALENAGYKKSGLGVPLSNGELPTASYLRNKWIEMRKESK